MCTSNVVTKLHSCHCWVVPLFGGGHAWRLSAVTTRITLWLAAQSEDSSYLGGGGGGATTANWKASSPSHDFLITRINAALINQLLIHVLYHETCETCVIAMFRVGYCAQHTTVTLCPYPGKCIRISAKSANPYPYLCPGKGTLSLW